MMRWSLSAQACAMILPSGFFITPMQEGLRVAGTELRGNRLGFACAALRQHQLVQLAQSNLAEHDAILGDVRKIVAIDAGRSLDLTQAQVRLDAAVTAIGGRTASPPAPVAADAQ